MRKPSTKLERPEAVTVQQACSVAHLRRLQEQNRLLAECLADERKLRKEAYAYYQRRLRSWWCRTLDAVVTIVRH